LSQSRSQRNTHRQTMLYQKSINLTAVMFSSLKTIRFLSILFSY